MIAAPKKLKVNITSFYKYSVIIEFINCRTIINFIFTIIT